MSIFSYESKAGIYAFIPWGHEVSMFSSKQKDKVFTKHSVFLKLLIFIWVIQKIGQISYYQPHKIASQNFEVPAVPKFLSSGQEKSIIPPKQKN